MTKEAIGYILLGFIVGSFVTYIFGMMVGLGNELGVCKKCGEPWP